MGSRGGGESIESVRARAVEVAAASCLAAAPAWAVNWPAVIGSQVKTTLGAAA